MRYTLALALVVAVLVPGRDLEAQQRPCEHAACCPTCPSPPSQHEVKPPGVPGCTMAGWSFGDPAAPGSRAAFLAFARRTAFYTDHRAAKQAVKLPDGSSGPWARIEPYVHARGVPFRRVAREQPETRRESRCRGMLLARVIVDGRLSSNERVVDAAEAHYRMLVYADSGHSLSMLDSADAVGGYKTYIHCHQRRADGTCAVRHPHALYPEGASYLWIDSIAPDAGGGMRGRAVIVPDNLFLIARVVRVRFCRHADLVAASPPAGCEFHGMVDVNQDLAAWLDVPGDEDAWAACSEGCCRVEHTGMGT